MEKKPQIGLLVSLVPVLFVVCTLFLAIYVFQQDAHIPLVLGSAVAAIIAFIYKHTWDDIQDGILQGIQLAMGAMLILMVIGTMIGTWLLAGIVPAMIYYGLQLLSPGVFLVATLIICSIISLGTGSSWSTVATVGVALIAVGDGLGIPTYIVGGAIISGSYFGDKMSPLSDTTNLAPACAGTDVFSHIRHMIYTTGPSYIITIIIYIFIGISYSDGTLDSENINTILATIDSKFYISPELLLAPVLVIVMVILKIPPLPALLAGSVIGGIMAIIFQSATLASVFDVAQNGFKIETELASVNELLSGGGLLGMMKTVALIICALSFGGIMEKTGMLATIAASLLARVKRTGSLVATTIFSCISMNIISADQYMSIVIPGRMYKAAFDKKGLHPKNLSRVLEDSATLTSPLVPWNTCGAFMWATLGVYPLLYLPYAFFNLINPLISLFYGYTGITMEKIDDNSKIDKEKLKDPV
ncbi:MAG: Na+/H+ antiporter NhaC [Rhodothermaceae bacterium]